MFSLSFLPRYQVRFLTDAFVLEDLDFTPLQSAEAAHARAVATGARCSECPLYGCRKGPVLAELPTDTASGLVIVGAYPQDEEVSRGRPLVGRIGEFVGLALLTEHVTRTSCAATSVIKCQPPDDYEKLARKWKRAGVCDPVECCAPSFHHDLEAAKGRTILTLGALALEAVARLYQIPVGKAERRETKRRGLAKIKAQRGHPFILPDNRVLMPALLPSTTMHRDQAYMLEPTRRDIRRAAQIAKRGHALNFVDGRYLLRPTLEDVIAWISQALEIRVKLMVDIETNGKSRDALIRCVGLGYRDSANVVQVIVIPLHVYGGTAYWQPHEQPQAEHWIRRALTELVSQFAYGQFDTARLIREDLYSPSKPWADLLVAHHNTRDNDTPHSVAFVTSRLEMDWPLHKNDIDLKDAEGIDNDENLWLYNARDVMGQILGLELVKTWINLDATTKQNDLDHRKVILARDMGERGCVIDLAEKQRLHDVFTAREAELLASMRRTTGIAALNPNSRNQVADWIYGTKHLTPALATGGLEWEEGEDAAVSIPAFLALYDSATEADVIQFLDDWIMFRSVMKLRSSNVDNLQLVFDVPWPELARVHPNFNAHVVPSGRFSCSEPNVQQWASRGVENMWKMLVAPPGHVYVAADFDQIEVRIYAAESGDRHMRKAILDGLDPHALNFATMIARSETELQNTYQQIVAWKKSHDKTLQTKAKYLRTIAKRLAFLIFYGGRKAKLFSTMRGDRDKATGRRSFADLKPAQVEAWFENFLAAHPELQPWQQRVLNFVALHRYSVERVGGRKRWFLDGAGNDAVNHTIQGAAAAICDRAILEIDADLRKLAWSRWSGVNLQIHDSIAAVVPEDRVEETKVIFARAMTQQIDDIPITAEVGAARCLADA